MQKISKILSQNPNIPVIRQLYGQSTGNLVSQLKQYSNQSLYLIARKSFGLKSLLKYLQEQGHNYAIIGKEGTDTRLVEITVGEDLKLPKQEETGVYLELQGKKLRLQTQNSIFSREKIDDGTKILLDYLATQKIPERASILDLGAGYGAISVYLKQMLPESNLICYEIDPSSCENLAANLKPYQGVSIHCQDFFNSQFSSKIDYLIANPPLHISSKERQSLFSMVYENKPSLKLALVIKSRFTARFLQSATAQDPSIQALNFGKYDILTNF